MIIGSAYADEKPNYVGSIRAKGTFFDKTSPLLPQPVIGRDRRLRLRVFGDWAERIQAPLTWRVFVETRTEKKKQGALGQVFNQSDPDAKITVEWNISFGAGNLPSPQTGTAKMKHGDSKEIFGSQNASVQTKPYNFHGTVTAKAPGYDPVSITF